MSIPSFWEFAKDQYEDLPILPTVDSCQGKTYVVTGANTGLGFECAKHLVRLSAKRVILGVRSLSRGEEAKAKIETETSLRGIAEVWQLDLDSYESVKAFAKKVRNLDRIDAIIENASIALDKYTASEGLETTLTVNVVSTFLLAVLVYPKLQETAKTFGTKTNLEVVGSGTGFDESGVLEGIDGDILEGLDKAPLVGAHRYPQSKLLQLYAIRHFASLKPESETGVNVNLVNPGLCKTELSRHVGLTFRIMLRIMQLLLGRTAEMGSRTLLHGVMAGVEEHGKYLSGCRIAESKIPLWMTDASGKETQARVWRSLTEKLDTIEPGCVEACFGRKRLVKN